MRTVLLAWQLGGGLGHLHQCLPLARGLAARGHRVFLAVRDLPAAASAYAEAGVHFLPSPSAASAAGGRGARGDRVVRTVLGTFAYVMASSGFGDDRALFGTAAAWRNLFRLVRPDLIVFDHAPTALLATRGLPARRALIGSGFCCPPGDAPFPALRTRPHADTELAEVAAAPPAAAGGGEEPLLRRANWILGHWKQPPLERLGQLYSEVDECFLTTFPELDHYGERPGVRYWGPVNAAGGKAPQWPADGCDPAAPRVAAYLKPFPALPALLDVLAERRWPTLVFGDSIGPKLRELYSYEPCIRFETQRLDPAATARGCDLAITNATHGTTCDLLLAGRPCLMFPLHAEQELTAAAVTRLGAGEALPPRRKDRGPIEAALDRLLSDARYAAAARAFSERHADFDPAEQQAAMLRRACELLEGARPAPLPALALASCR